MRSKELLVAFCSIASFYVLPLPHTPRLFSQHTSLLAQNNIHHAPPTFGSTHFIAGYTGNMPSHQTSALSLNKQKNPSIKVMYSPDNAIRTHLIKLIHDEKKSIKIAAFSFTDKELMQTLCSAHKRGIAIELVTDPCMLQDRHSKINDLLKGGIHVYVYNPHYAQSGQGSCMHHKFLLFENNKNNQPILWTGSLNLTRAACERNQENILIIKDRSVVDQFAQQFEILKKRSRQYK